MHGVACTEPCAWVRRAKPTDVQGTVHPARQRQRGCQRCTDGLLQLVRRVSCPLLITFAVESRLIRCAYITLGAGPEPGKGRPWPC